MTKSDKPKHKAGGIVTPIVIIFALLIGLSLLLYPTVADYINSLDYKKDIEDYQNEVQKLDDTARQKMLENARVWNTELLANSSRIGALPDEQRQRYQSLLDPSGTGMMGYVEIESIGVYLPIYHGTDESALYSGIGHLEGSSLPVGGTGVHTLLSGHTGLPSSKLFSNIDQLKLNDTFELHILGEILTYKVENIAVLLPEEAEEQKIDPERDLCTLMTCTPYGVNTHRLLVRGVRIETPQVVQRPEGSTKPVVEPVPTPLPLVLRITIVALPTVLIVTIIVLIVRRSRRRRREYDEKR